MSRTKRSAPEPTQTPPMVAEDATLRLGLLGHGVAHSLSPTLHRAGLDALGLPGTYGLHEAASEAEARAIVASLRAGALSGLNVTTPFKGLAASLADDVADEVARRSANTLWMSGGRLQAGSSDGPGLLLALAAVGVQVRGLRVGVLGAGGVAAAVSASFVDAGADLVWVMARDPKACAAVAAGSGARPLAWGNATLPAVDLCIQATRIGHGAADATSLSTSERAAVLALGDAIWRLDALWVDLVVARGGLTPLQRLGVDAGLPERWDLGRGVLPQSGAAMLAAQAAISLGWWTGRAPPLPSMAAAIGVDWFERAPSRGGSYQL